MPEIVPSLADTKGSVSFILQGIKGWSWRWRLCADLCEAAKIPVPLLVSQVFVSCCVPLDRGLQLSPTSLEAAKPAPSVAGRDQGGQELLLVAFPDACSLQELLMAHA